ncbi:MAG: tRNA pseudouridine(55) synthase TruB [Acidobacteriota bacterium]
MKDGLLLIDKETHCTSHDVVQQARRILKQKKIGHCGTLDPDATGLLLLTLGKATRLTRFLIRAPKVYEGLMRFGISTDTYDASGKVTAEASTAGIDQESIAAGMAQFVGTHPQSPPPYSAKKVGGVRYYELARRGEEVPETSKDVTVYEFSPLGPLETDRQAFRLGCSSGTYARSLAHDLGRKLGCGAHLAALRRTQIGAFKVADALTLGGLSQALESETPVGAAWVSFDEVLLPFAEVAADAQQENRIVNGQTVLMRDFHAEEGDWVKVVNRRREFIAVGTVVERIGSGGVGVIQPKVVFK